MNVVSQNSHGGSLAQRLLPQLQRLVRWESAMDPAIILLTGFRTTSVRLSASVTVLRDFRRRLRSSTARTSGPRRGLQCSLSSTVEEIILFHFNNYCQNLKGETTQKVKQYNYLFQFNYWICNKGETISTFS